MDKKKYTAIILSAGTGSRMKSNMPKQYMELLGQPVIYYSIKAFEDSPVDEIVIVCSADYIEYFRHSIIEKYAFKKVKAIVQGGKERYNSVYEGLKAANGTDYVLIHDGARPLVDNEIIVRSMHTVEKEKARCGPFGQRFDLWTVFFVDVVGDHFRNDRYQVRGVVHDPHQGFERSAFERALPGDVFLGLAQFDHLVAQAVPFRQ